MILLLADRSLFRLRFERDDLGGDGRPDFGLLDSPANVVAAVVPLSADQYVWGADPVEEFLRLASILVRKLTTLDQLAKPHPTTQEITY
jgi:hypothetical protein